MRIFQSFLILFSVCFSSGCATPQKQKKHEQDDFRTPAYFSPNYGYFAKQGDLLTSDKVFISYCQNKKQIREYRLSVQVIFPRSTPGTSIDSAGLQINEYRKSIPRLLKAFINTSFKLAGPRLHSVGNKVAVVATNNNSKNIIEIFKNDKRYSEGNSEQAEMLYLEDQSRLLMNFMPSLAEKEILYSTEESPGQISDLYLPATASSFKDHPYIAQVSHSFKPEDIKYLSVLSMKALPVESSKKDDSSFIITQVENLEKVKLFDEYLLLIPLEVANEWEIHPKYKLHDENGAINISQAVHLKDMIWDKLIESQTKITESATEDSRTFKYEANLDLSLACTYARPLKNLTVE